ncbi:MAG: ketoacyl-ACP synthase III [Oscillospiraceae bacterium]|nr:ketoacyl-ACP synthase III [Oscillospiraceae bacterium]
MEVRRAGIYGTGYSLPGKVLTNRELEGMVDTTDEWIFQRTGIRERRILEKGRPGYELAVEAAGMAMERSGTLPGDLGLIIATTITPDYFAPSLASIVQGKVGAGKAFAFDLGAACCGFVYALAVADGLIKSGTCEKILIVSCEIHSRVVDWTDRATCIILGDGAAAAVVGPATDGTGLMETYMGTDGRYGHLVTIPNGYLGAEDIGNRAGAEKRVFWQDGKEVYKFAVKVMAEAAGKVLDKAGMTYADMDMVVPHQANLRIIEGAMRRMDVDPDKVHRDIATTGNLSSASIPYSLSQLDRGGRLRLGDNVLLVGFGAGLSWGSAYMRWSC